MPLPIALGATSFFLSLDALLVAGCAVKFVEGGWFPLALGLIIFTGMSTWSRGRDLLFACLRKEGLELGPFVESIERHAAHRVARTAVYPVADPSLVPQALLHNLKHNQVLHERNIILTVRFAEVPFVPDSERIVVQPLGPTFWKLAVTFGFMQTPDVPEALRQVGSKGLDISVFETTYFLSRETVVPSPGAGMAHWRERVFAAMSRNAGGVVEFFRLPDNAVVELGTRVQI